MSYKKRNKNNLLKTLFIGLAWLSITVFGNYLYNQYILKSVDNICFTENTESNNTENIDKILLATKNKLIDANIFIQVNYESGIEIGSGTIINKDNDYYYAITNYHVIDGNNEVVDSKLLITSDSVVTDYEIIFQNQELDLAYIRFTKSGRSEITPIIVDDNNISLGSMVVSIGNPFGNEATVNYGNALRFTYLRELELTHTVLEHDATLANGSSGGALVDIYGHLIGINTWELNNKYYAIPISVINIFLENNL